MSTLVDLAKYRMDITSQNGENGVLMELLRRLDIDSGNLIEFGVYDGKLFSNTLPLIQTGRWKGLYIEPGDQYYRLEKLATSYPNLQIIHGYVYTKDMVEYTPGTSINEIIDAYFDEVDVLSIDIDSYDYKVFMELERRPKIIIIEIDAAYPPGVERFVLAGSSFSSMVNIGKIKEYTPVCDTAFNIFFLRNDLCEGFEIPDPDEIFDWTSIREMGQYKDENGNWIKTEKE